MFAEKMKDKRVLFPVLAASVLFCAVIGYILWDNREAAAFAVLVDDRQVCLVKDSGQIKSLVKEIKASEEKRIGHQVKLESRVDFRRCSVEREDLTDRLGVEEILREKLHFSTKAAQIVVNGAAIALLPDCGTAEKVLAGLKEKYSACASGETLKSAVFLEKVDVRECTAAARKILDADDAAALLSTGGEKPVRYTVKEGDSLWLIARRHNTHVATIMESNGLKSEKLKPDQEIIITACKPYVTVAAVMEGSKKETIAYSTRVVYDRNLGGASKEKQKGQNGEKQVAYQVEKHNGVAVKTTVTKETVTQKPVERIVARGSSSTMTASRGGGRTIGGLIWPAFGKITSAFGTRGGRHTGIDIDRKTGDPVKAAKDGVVTFTGRSGGYGLMVTISHGNGLVTRYAHLSKISVNSGQRVSQGQVIGRVGSTGNSTGAHLHFEVINNGSFVNPKRYLN